MTVTSGTSPKRLLPGVHHFYGDALKAYDPIYSKLFSMIKSNKAYEEMVGLAGTGLMTVKNQGGALSSDNIQQGHIAKITPIVYGKLLTMTMEAIEDDQYAPKLSQKIANYFAKSKKESVEIIAHSVLNDAFSTTSSLMYVNPDGKALIATDHVLVKGGSFSNKLSSSASLNELSLEQLITQIRNWTSEEGFHINVMPKKLVIPPALEFDAIRLLRSELQSGSANNDVNAVKSAYDLEIVVSPYLTDTNAWYIITDQNTADEGLVMIERGEDAFSADEEFTTLNARMRMYCRLAVGYIGPRCIAGSDGG